MALSRHAHHAPPPRSKKRQQQQLDTAADPTMLSLQAQTQPAHISSSRDASEEDNDDDDDDDEDEEDDDDGGGGGGGPVADAGDDAGAHRGEGSERKHRSLSKAERAARRAATARRHPSSDDADADAAALPAASAAPIAAAAAEASASASAASAPPADPTTVSPSRRTSTHASVRDRDRDQHAHITATLAHTSAALHQHQHQHASALSSSASNPGGDDDDDDDGEHTSSSASQIEVPASALLARRAPAAAAAQQAQSTADGTGAVPAGGLHLGSLPEVRSDNVAEASALPTVTGSTSATQTPRPATAALAAGGSLSALGSNAAAGASSAHAHGRAATSSQKKSASRSGLGRIAADGSADRADDEGTDGAGGTPYDGDVEGPNPSKQAAAGQGIPFPVLPGGAGPSSSPSPTPAAHHQSGGSAPDDTPLTLPTGGPRPRTRLRSDASDKEHAILAAPKAPAEIRAYIRDCISGERAKGRNYAIREPRDGGGTRERPIRIYADGVFDMFHYAHTLLLRQAKLFFPHVHLIAGVNSSTLCAEHKNRPLLSSEERYASVAACKWVDEVIVDAPWFITPDFIAVHKIDYVAHDDAPYANASSGSADVYGWLKDEGLFLPTLRTEGVSTSELLGRVVEVYQSHALDDKLRKVGLEKLIDSRSPSGQTSPQHPQQQQHGAQEDGGKAEEEG